MTRVRPLAPGQILTGSLFNEPVRVETVQANGPASWVVGLVGMQSERFRKVTLTAADLERLTTIDTQRSFDGDGRLLRLGLQAYALANELSALYPMGSEEKRLLDAMVLSMPRRS